jgi:hypothetical protein
MFVDGLHLSKLGHDALYNGIYDKINDELPQLLPTNLDVLLVTYFRLI